MRSSRSASGVCAAASSARKVVRILRWSSKGGELYRRKGAARRAVISRPAVRPLCDSCPACGTSGGANAHGDPAKQPSRAERSSRSSSISRRRTIARGPASWSGSSSRTCSAGARRGQRIRLCRLAHRAARRRRHRRPCHATRVAEAARGDGPEGESVQSVEAYVTTLTKNAVRDLMRRRSPERTRLKSRLRYLFRHDERLALWSEKASRCAVWRHGKVAGTTRAGAPDLADLTGDAMLATLTTIGKPLRLADLVAATSRSSRKTRRGRTRDRAAAPRCVRSAAVSADSLARDP